MKPKPHREMPKRAVLYNTIKLIQKVHVRKFLSASVCTPIDLSYQSINSSTLHLSISQSIDLSLCMSLYLASYLSLWSIRVDRPKFSVGTASK
jgi:hypothetical protein